MTVKDLREKLTDLPDDMPWAKDNDEKRRAWALDRLLNSQDYSSVSNAVKDANIVVEWLRAGILPEDKTSNTLKVIK